MKTLQKTINLNQVIRRNRRKKFKGQINKKNLRNIKKRKSLSVKKIGFIRGFVRDRRSRSMSVWRLFCSFFVVCWWDVSYDLLLAKWPLLSHLSPKRNFRCFWEYREEHREGREWDFRDLIMFESRIRALQFGFLR